MKRIQVAVFMMAILGSIGLWQAWGQMEKQRILNTKIKQITKKQIQFQEIDRKLDQLAWKLDSAQVVRTLDKIDQDITKLSKN
jgi:hypothetical protein